MVFRNFRDSVERCFALILTLVILGCGSSDGVVYGPSISSSVPEKGVSKVTQIVTGGATVSRTDAIPRPPPLE